MEAKFKGPHSSISNRSSKLYPNFLAPNKTSSKIDILFSLEFQGLIAKKLMISKISLIFSTISQVLQVKIQKNKKIKSPEILFAKEVNNKKSSRR
jgi:hypothetical protein